MVHVKIVKREERKMDTLVDEIQAHKEHGNDQLHECKILGHVHPPLPTIKGMHGNSIMHYNYLII